MATATTGSSPNATSAATGPRPLAGALGIVTGPLGKLGPTWVTELARAGADVVGIDVGDRGAAQLGEAVAQLGTSFRLERADVVDKSSLLAVRDRIAELGPPAVLVNGAGIDQPPDAAATRHRIEDVPTEAFRGTLDVNLVGAFHAIQVFGAAMRDAGAGSIVNIGSLYASIAPEPAFYDHYPGDPPFLKPAAYGASKAGLLHLTRYFARLWGPHGVRVNALSPGGVHGEQDPEFLRKYCARVPLGRMAEPEDLAGPLVFLASDASRYVTGHELRVDGGFTA
jgi:NAD(P)-dependent dehydrogenase (short-subunit alcohol dehydrogenase family)